MARPKIRHTADGREVRLRPGETLDDAAKYLLASDEILVFQGATRFSGECQKALEKQRLELERPRFGLGSGRPGGQRSSIHVRYHRRWWGDIKPEWCPICRYGMKLWHLWNLFGPQSEEWEAYWEKHGTDDERKAFEHYVTDLCADVDQELEYSYQQSKQEKCDWDDEQELRQLNPVTPRQEIESEQTISDDVVI